MNIGLKLWSTNDYYMPLLEGLYQDGHFDYVELYAVPGSFDRYSRQWGSFHFPYVIHAPNDTINLSVKEMAGKNQDHFQEAKKFADLLKAEKIIIHAGLDGTIQESGRQLNLLDDKRLVIENVPPVGLQGQTCVGASLEEIKQILAECPSAGFCLDFGHAITYASCQGIPYRDVLEGFSKMSPLIYHLCDGNYADQRDKHLNLGAGEYDFGKILGLVPEGSMVSLETPKGSKGDLNDFVKDSEMLKKYWNLKNFKIEKEAAL